MKYILTVLLVVFVAASLTGNVYAYEKFGKHDTVTGSKAYPITHQKIEFHSDETRVLMQDVTQCVLSTDGTEILCVDVCGGRSTIGSICTME